jgi:hypothetical protein
MLKMPRCVACCYFLRINLQQFLTVLALEVGSPCSKNTNSQSGFHMPWPICSFSSGCIVADSLIMPQEIAQMKQEDLVWFGKKLYDRKNFFQYLKRCHATLLETLAIE